MIDTICDEITLRKDYLPEKELRSIYFGGGTPSLLDEHELKQIMSVVRSNFKLNDNTEITLEANPDDISIDSLESWKSAGINRLSIGLQSFKETDLKWMNRAHSAVESQTAVSLARSAGFDLLTVDLIYGLPGLTNAEWKDHLLKVIDMGADHISAYCLTVEKNTSLNKWVEQGKILPASEDQQSDQFMILSETLEEAGFEQYEISNFARNKQYAVHNTAYWTGIPYLGVGPSAHSFDGKSRRWNIANNRKYIRDFGKNEDWYSSEVLSVNERWNELILTGLRTIFGVSLGQLFTIKTASEEFSENLENFRSQGLLIIEDEKIILTKTGKLQADFIASELFI